MEPGPDLTSLLQRALGGDHAAAEEIVRTYGRGMLRAVRNKLTEQLRPGFDSNDFTQAAWLALLEKRIEGKAQFVDAKALGAFLALVSERKVQETARRENSQKRGGKRRQRLDSEMAQTGAMANEDPTPSQQAVATEAWQRLVENLSERDRRILELRYQGHTKVEIGELLGIAESTVRYVLEKVFEKARELK
jgi:RNA polymerase sigma factor (sigma-70 family)